MSPAESSFVSAELYGGICARLPIRRNRSVKLANKLSKIETVGLVGGETLIGREIRDAFATTHFPARLSLIASEADETGVLTEVEGEPAVVRPLDPLALGEAKAAFLAGSPESTRAAMALGLDTPLIDLTYA